MSGLFGLPRGGCDDLLSHPQHKPEILLSPHSHSIIQPFRWPLSAENDVGGVIGGLMFGDAVAERRQVDPSKDRFALPEHDRGQSNMQLVNQTGAKILTHRLGATTNLHVTALGGEPRLLQRRL